MLDNLFVYGSLMGSIDSPIARRLRDHADFMGEAVVKGYLYDLGRYPGLIEDLQSNYLVKGHIFKMKNPETLLAILDEYEGAANPHVLNEYRRDHIKAKLNGHSIECWAYIYNLSTKGLPYIKSGNYLDYLKNNLEYQRFIDSV